MKQPAMPSNANEMLVEDEASPTSDYLSTFED